ncbi:MAG TPA: hypothetical protein VGX50_14840 [Longimicrobium sp.]|jgi:hypothetical protein|nr:hypothetical protein [Longimicrobium sp.]
MMPFLEGLALWVGYTLAAGAWLIVGLLTACLPLALVYAAMFAVARLIGLVRRRRPRLGGMR